MKRLFWKMKLIKIHRRSKQEQVKLYQLFRIGIELPKEGFYSIYKYFVDELKKQNPKTRLKFSLKLLVFCFTYILYLAVVYIVDIGF